MWPEDEVSKSGWKPLDEIAQAVVDRQFANGQEVIQGEGVGIKGRAIIKIVDYKCFINSDMIIPTMRYKRSKSAWIGLQCGLSERWDAQVSSLGLQRTWWHIAFSAAFAWRILPVPKSRALPLDLRNIMDETDLEQPIIHPNETKNLPFLHLYLPLRFRFHPHGFPKCRCRSWQREDERKRIDPRVFIEFSIPQSWFQECHFREQIALLEGDQWRRTKCRVTNTDIHYYLKWSCKRSVICSRVETKKPMRLSSV